MRQRRSYASCQLIPVLLLRLAILFVIVPLVELWLLLQISHWMSSIFTLLLVIGTGLLGAWLARLQGVRSWQRIRQSLSAGKMPTEPLADGVMILAAAALLLTPGVLTDLFGFTLLIPPCRAIYRPRLLRSLRTRFGSNPSQDDDAPPPQQDRVIDSYVVQSPDEGSHDSH